MFVEIPRDDYKENQQEINLICEDNDNGLLTNPVGRNGKSNESWI